jgi:cytoskeleton protein RodZ
MNDSEVENQNPGATFKTSRERLGLSINDVAVATKINPRILRALEAGDHSELPASSFARGFIRSYAAYLKIDSKPILEAFTALAPTPVTPPAAATSPGSEVSSPATAPSDTPAAPRVSEKVESPRATHAVKRLPKMTAFHDASVTSKVILAGGLLILVGMIFGVRKVINKYAQERVIEPVVTTASEEAPTETTLPENPDPANPVLAAGPSTATPTATATSSNATPVASEAAPAATVAPPAATPPIQKPDTVATVTLQEKMPPAPTTTPQKPSETSAKATTAATPTTTVTPPAAAPAPTATPTKPASVPQEVILEALDTVEIKVVIDGVSQKIVLKPEAVHTIKAKTSIQLDIADGGMVNVIHNGLDRGVPGSLGSPLKVKYP